MAVELYHRADDDTVRVTFDDSGYSDFVRLSRGRYEYCIDKHGKYRHYPEKVHCVATADADMYSPDYYDIEEDPEVTGLVVCPVTSNSIFNKIQLLRILL